VQCTRRHPLELLSLLADSRSLVAVPKRKSDLSDQRPIRDVLDRITNRWTILVLCTLDERGTVRFSGLRQMIDDISQCMLARTLRGLEQDGLLSRSVYPTTPPRVEYALTPLGKSLLEPLQELVSWARRNERRVVDARRRYGTRSCEPLTPVGP
jgi:DNA-binding HxlR family transcriptional regulator